MPKPMLSTFRVEVTPPLGFPLGGFRKVPAVGFTDPLLALGVVLVGDDGPVVLCAVDWCEISNEDHALWVAALADAAGTSSDRVAVQSVHQHDAPWPDRDAQKLVAPIDDLDDIMDVSWCDSAMERVAEGVRASLDAARPVTHVGLGEARVEQVASNRRIMGPDGKVKGVRYTSCKEPELRAEPEGLIDPMLKTVSFWSGDTKLAALHYYAVHPCSYFGDGWINSDFVGYARARREAEEPGVAHVYFTGCAGNVGPGKYNDGSRKWRAVFTDRIHAAMVESERRAERFDAAPFEWRTRAVALPPDMRRSEEQWLDILSDSAAPYEPDRVRAALRLSAIHRLRAGGTFTLSSLLMGGTLCLLHLPGEPFIEYQLYAQEQRPDCFVAVAGYGDCAAGYITMADSFEQGGYEPKDAFVAPESDPITKQAITELLAP